MVPSLAPVPHAPPLRGYTLDFLNKPNCGQSTTNSTQASVGAVVFRTTAGSGSIEIDTQVSAIFTTLKAPPLLSAKLKQKVTLMDSNGDGWLKKQEFIEGCCADSQLNVILGCMGVPEVSGSGGSSEQHGRAVAGGAATMFEEFPPPRGEHRLAGVPPPPPPPPPVMLSSPTSSSRCDIPSRNTCKNVLRSK